MPTVLVAMDKFKGSATAAEACASVCAGIRTVAPNWSCRELPLADGGDGTVDALLEAGWRPGQVDTIDGQGEPVASLVAVDGRRAVVELANICGIARWRGELDPWRATTIGLGRVLRAMVEDGMSDVSVGLGGSASTDGGLGVLAGLGFEVVDDSGDPVPPGLIGLESASRIVAPADIDLLRSVRWTVLADVDASLFGPLGAAFRFGPQKGLSTEEIARADELLRRWDAVLAANSARRVGDVPGTGAAGGVGAALVSQLDARIVSGFDFVARQVGLDAAVASAHAVVTGEGHLDETSLIGKVVGEVLTRAREVGKPSCVVVGDVDELLRGDIPESVFTLVEFAGSREAAMGDAVTYLRQAGQSAGQWLRDPGHSVTGGPE